MPVCRLLTDSMRVTNGLLLPCPALDHHNQRPRSHLRSPCTRGTIGSSNRVLCCCYQPLRNPALQHFMHPILAAGRDQIYPLDLDRHPKQLTPDRRLSRMSTSHPSLGTVPLLREESSWATPSPSHPPAASPLTCVMWYGTIHP